MAGLVRTKVLQTPTALDILTSLLDSKQAVIQMYIDPLHPFVNELGGLHVTLEKFGYNRTRRHWTFEGTVQDKQRLKRQRVIGQLTGGLLDNLQGRIAFVLT